MTREIDRAHERFVEAGRVYLRPSTPRDGPEWREYVAARDAYDALSGRYEGTEQARNIAKAIRESW